MSFKLFIILLTLLGLAGCGSKFLTEPIGISGDRDALKASPCACNEIPQHYGEWHRLG